MQCSWIKKLYYSTISSWKVILLHLIKTNLVLNFKFHLNLDISVSKLKKFPTYYNIILQNWYLHLTSSVLLSTITSEALR